MAKNKPHVRNRTERKFEEEVPESFMKLFPTWSFKRMDFSHPKWSLKRCDALFDKVLLKLKDYESMTWAEITSASGGKAEGHGSNNHYEYVESLSKEARDRSIKIHLDSDTIFSLRLSGRERLYGLIDKGVYFIIWYDSDHEIYPVSR